MVNPQRRGNSHDKTTLGYPANYLSFIDSSSCGNIRTWSRTIYSNPRMIQHWRSDRRQTPRIEDNGLHGSFEQNTPTRSMQSSKFKRLNE